MRERKKGERREALLDAAQELFGRRGFHETKMEDIAATADVSNATVYNYFPTKQSLLFGLIRRFREAMLPTLEAAAATAIPDPGQAISEFIACFVEDMEQPEQKRLWREIMAETLRAEDSADEFSRNREAFFRYFVVLVTRLQQRGHLAEQSDTQAAAELLYAIMFSVFRRCMAVPGHTRAEARAAIETLVATALAGWLPRSAS